MKIVVTNTFTRSFQKFRGKSFPNKEDFIRKLFSAFCSKYNYLQRPYLKLKLNYKNKTLRIVVKYSPTTDILIPILLTDKNDKLYGENMTRDIVENIIEIINQKNIQDIQMDDYETFTL